MQASHRHPNTQMLFNHRIHMCPCTNETYIRTLLFNNYGTNHDNIQATACNVHTGLMTRAVFCHEMLPDKAPKLIATVP